MRPLTGITVDAVEQAVADTEAVRRELGFCDADITAMRQTGAIGSAATS